MIGQTIKIVAFCCLLFYFAGGCKTKTLTVGEKEAGIESLNNRDYTEAQRIFSDLCKANRTDYESCVYLASADAGLVGIDIVTLFQVLKPFIYDEDKKMKNTLKALQGKLSQGSDSIDSYVLSYFSVVSEVIQTTRKFPRITIERRSALVEALLLIKDTPIESRFYRQARDLSFLINIAQMMNYLMDAFPNIVNESDATMENFICEFQPSRFIESVEAVVRYALASVEDYNYIKMINGKKAADNLRNLQESSQNMKAILDEYKKNYSGSDLILARVKPLFCH